MNEHIRIAGGCPVTLQYYVPFRFEDSRFSILDRAFASAKHGETRLWRESAFPVDRGSAFYEHVLSLMNVRRNPNSVCHSWQLIPPEGNRYMFVRNQEERIPFTLSGVYAHLFRAGIGFISYQVSFADDTVRESGQLVSFQSRLKKLSRQDKELYILDIADGRETWQQVRLGQMILDLLPDETCEEIAFFGTVEKYRLPAAAMMFSYLCYDCEDREPLKELTVHMALGYSSDNLQSPETIQSCLQLNSDIFYYATQNGCAVSVHLTEQNRDFFVNHSPSSKYGFILFILFYQHCALLNFTMRLFTDFPSDAQAYIGNADFADRMQDFMTDVDTFLMKSDISTVSGLTQHNLFYDTCRKAMHIEEDRQSLRSGFDSLSGIQKSNQQRDREEQERKDEEEKEKQNLKIEFLAIFLGLAEILSEVVNFAERVILLCTKPGDLTLLDWIAMGLFLVICVLVTAMIIRIKRNKQAKKQEVNHP